MESNPRVLVTGAAGQVGRALATRSPRARLLDRRQLDVTHEDEVLKALRAYDVIFHCAAMTDVDACEAAPEAAHEINAVGTKNVVEAAARAGAKVVYLSTDYVFDGRKPDAYSETDRPNPINEYGRSKLEGERYVLDSGKHLIVRTSWVIGEGSNFVRSILSVARTRPILKVVEDQIGRPTFAEDLARTIISLVEIDAEGIFHASSDGPACSWADLAEACLQATGSVTSVERVDSETYLKTAGRLMAPRPANSLFDLRKLKSAGVRTFDWRASLTDYLDRFRK